MRGFKLLIVALAICSFLFSCGRSASTPNANSTVVTSTRTNTTLNSSPGSDKTDKRPESAVVGVADDDIGSGLYAKKCMICHKDTGKGGKVTIEGKTLTAADLTSAKIKAKSDETLLSRVKEGVPDEGMPAFEGKLRDEEIKLIIGKIRQF